MWKLFLEQPWRQSFAPLFMVQFLGALNDNLFKNALVVWITFKLSQTESESGLLVTLAAGLFILPFVLASPYAGRLADQSDKIRLIRKINLAEVGVMGLGALAFTSQSVVLMLVALFLMGTQSAFFGPIKYSILPQLLSGEKLIQGNSLFSGSTFIAILLGTILGGLGIMAPGGETIMAIAVIITATLGYLFSLRIKADLSPSEASVGQSFTQLIKQARSVPIAFKSVLAISWFWFFGAVMLSQIPPLVKYQIQGDDSVVVLLLTLFSVGIAIGSLWVARFMKAGVHLKWHKIFLIGMSLCLALSVYLIQSYQVDNVRLISVSQLLAIWPLNFLLLTFTLMSFFGGAYIVPLYTLVQTHTPEMQRARMIAVNNIINSLLMVLSALLIMLGYALGLELVTMLYLLAFINLLVIIWFRVSINLGCKK